MQTVCDCADVKRQFVPCFWRSDAKGALTDQAFDSDSDTNDLTRATADGKQWSSASAASKAS